MNAIAKRTRKQIEQHIEKCAESIQNNGLEIGRDLIEIRDDELWSDEYESWDDYWKNGVPSRYKTGVRLTQLMECAEVEKRLPMSTNSDVRIGLKASHYQEIARLAPNTSDGKGQQKQYDKLRKQDVARVIKAATEIARESAPPEKKAEATPSVRDIRKAVDAELGIDRTKQAKEAKQEREYASKIDLFQYISRMSGTIEGWLSVLQEVPAEGWDFLTSENPEVLDEVKSAVAELAAFLRS